MKDDYEAEAENTNQGYIVGLDSGPFDNEGNGDSFERCVVGRITPKGESFWVEVYGILHGKKSEKPVVAELMFRMENHIGIGVTVAAVRRASKSSSQKRWIVKWSRARFTHRR